MISLYNGSLHDEFLVMLFDSPIFIFLFLPGVLFGYFVVPKFFKNIFLLLASFFFYAWGDLQNVIILISIIAINYCAGIWIEKYKSKSKIILILTVLINVGILFSGKYLIFFLRIFKLPTTHLSPVIPLGISFIVFRIISYLIDIYRNTIKGEKNILHFSLYIMLFPIIIAGPIVRYVDIGKSLTGRKETLPLFSDGITRFIIGLGKKMIIANAMAPVVNTIFQLPSSELTFGLSWLAIISYTLQIYFDFSGYSDMAIGIGNMLGFTFKENFNYPYMSSSIKEFWQRWHISLSSWFRDYIYIPLGGNRHGTSRTYLHIFITFLLTGFWHGANFTFIVWGVYFGLFLSFEKFLNSPLRMVWKPIRHLYTLTVVTIGWVFFRSESLTQAVSFLKTMIGINNGGSTASIRVFLTNEYILIFLISLFGATPFLSKISDKWKSSFISIIILVCILLYSLAQLAGATHSSFIYFKF